MTAKVDVFCSRCNALCVPTESTTGYGYNRQHEPICFACCGELDRADMIETGKATLYLTIGPGWQGCGNVGPINTDYGHISNWPGTLRFPLYHSPKVGKHNLAGKRYDVWFKVQNNGKAEQWHGVQYGDNTQIAHCRRVKG